MTGALFVGIFMVAMMFAVFVTEDMATNQYERRQKYLENFNLSIILQKKLMLRYPCLSDDDISLVCSGLKEFFYACLMAAGNAKVVMPSRIIDDAWHEFILFTDEYTNFCETAFDRYLHHRPSGAITSQNDDLDGLRLAWDYACKYELIDPERPSRLPLLFALDAKFAVPNGHYYDLQIAANLRYPDIFQRSSFENKSEEYDFYGDKNRRGCCGG